MKDFNLKRFWNVVKWDLRCSRRFYISNAIVMYIPFTLFFLTDILFKPLGDNFISQYDIHRSTAICIVTAWYYMIICGNWVADNIKKKQLFVTFKMLPASEAEKFLARYSCIVVLGTVSLIVDFCLADITQALLCAILGITREVDGIFVAVRDLASYDIIKIHDIEAFWVTLAVIAVNMLAHSTYLLGGTIFRKKAFLMTSLAMFALVLLDSWLFVVCVDSIGIEDVAGEGEKARLSFLGMTMSFSSSAKDLIETLCYVVVTLMFAATAINYWLSFRFFKRAQISGKLLNL